MSMVSGPLADELRGPKIGIYQGFQQSAENYGASSSEMQKMPGTALRLRIALRRIGGIPRVRDKLRTKKLSMLWAFTSISQGFAGRNRLIPYRAQQAKDHKKSFNKRMTRC
jgi:hypothetical protein